MWVTQKLEHFAVIDGQTERVTIFNCRIVPGSQAIIRENGLVWALQLPSFVLLILFLSCSTCFQMEIVRILSFPHVGLLKP
jgi:hypothetical protein